MKRVLLLHRTEENNDYIEYAQKILRSKYVVSSMRDDKSEFYTSDLDTWLRSMASGYDIFGECRYHMFFIIGQYIDDTLVKLIHMIEDKPVFCITGGKFKPIETLNIEPIDNQTYRLGDKNE